MISATRIWTVILRYFYGSKRDLGRIFDFTYWPLVDIFLFGYIGVSLTTQQNTNLLLALILGLVLWQVTYRTNMEISRNFLQELWDNNLINLFSTPLTTIEWILGLMLTGLLSITITVLFGALTVRLFFDQNIFVFGPSIIFYILLLAMSGWILGMLGATFLMLGGKRVETMVWAIGWLPAPFCSVYYPVDVLPHWAQMVSKALPMSYAFEGVRSTLATGLIPVQLLLTSFVLNILYLVGMIALFYLALKRSKNKGLATLR
jgi:ABC-2 type transport system permease protein